MIGDLMPPHRVGNDSEPEYKAPKNLIPRQASEILRDMVPEADRPRLERACAAELRKIERETWWYCWFPPYRWYINWGWK